MEVTLYYLSLSLPRNNMQFLETGPELANHYNEIIAPQDVATYGGLCALASFDRTELKVSVTFSSPPPDSCVYKHV